MPTTYMSMTLPTVSPPTAGPTWAVQLTAALNVVDAHDHTAGKGVPLSSGTVTTALGYTPLKNTTDTLTGDLTVTGSLTTLGVLASSVLGDLAAFNTGTFNTGTVANLITTNVSGVDAKFVTVSGTTVTGTTALFTTATGTNVTGTDAKFTTITGVTITGTTVTGTTGIFSVVTGTTVTGTAAIFQTLTVNGSGFSPSGVSDPLSLTTITGTNITGTSGKFHTLTVDGQNVLTSTVIPDPLTVTTLTATNLNVNSRDVNTQPESWHVWYPGNPGDNAVLHRHINAGFNVTFADGFSGSFCYVDVNPTGTVNLIIKHGSTPVGTCSIDNTGQATFFRSGTFTVSDGGTLSLVNQASHDANLAGIAFTLYGSRSL